MERSWREVDLAVGDALQIGSFTLTVVDVEDGDVCFHLDSEDEGVELDPPPFLQATPHGLWRLANSSRLVSLQNN